jgi:hypothetical protein
VSIASAIKHTSHAADKTGMAAAYLFLPNRKPGSICVAIHVQEVAGGVLRVLSPRSLPVGSEAELVTAGTVLPTRVSLCERQPTGLFRVSLAGAFRTAVT